MKVSMFIAIVFAVLLIVVAIKGIGAFFVFMRQVSIKDVHPSEGRYRLDQKKRRQREEA